MDPRFNAVETAVHATVDGNDLATGQAPHAPLAPHEPIAVIGMSGRFPQAENIEAFWANLQAGQVSIGELPPNRFGDQRPQIRFAGVLEGIDEFEPEFFNISHHEARGIDPQHRLLMMQVYKTLEDAGYSMKSLSGSNTALLVGMGSSGYSQLQIRADEPVNAAYVMGNTDFMAPNRLSYWLNWHGPSEPINTACSSSLVAVHRAIMLLRSGQCDQAIVGGVNTLLAWDMHEGLTQVGVLSRSGQCHPFSEQANGFVRSEGIAMLMLKPLSAAERDGDNIYGLILGSAQNHGGLATSVSSPNPPAQAKVIEAAYRNAGVATASIGYIEAHGTGTRLGDPLEIQGLKQAFRAMAGDSELPENSIGLGSVKSNVGHLEWAAGVTGMIKVLLQMRAGCLVPSLNSQPLNPRIDLRHSPFYIVDTHRPWPAVKGADDRLLPRRAGVSSFGFGGVNAHVVLGEYSAKKPPATHANAGPVLVLLSARDARGLNARVTQLSDYLQRHQVELSSLAYTLQVGREAMKVRLAFVVNSIDELLIRLSSAQREEETAGIFRGDVKLEQELQDWFQHDEDLQEISNRLIAQGQLARLAQWWVRGINFDWQRLYGESKPGRISLPSYPFAKERYWFQSPGLSPELASPQAPAMPRQTPMPSQPPMAPQATTPIKELVPLVDVEETAGTVAMKTAGQNTVELAALEQSLRESLAAALRIDAALIESDKILAEYGMDSIVAVEWIRDINRRYEILLSTSKVYEFPTISKMAVLIRDTCEGCATSIPPAKADEPLVRQPVPLQQTAPDTAARADEVRGEIPLFELERELSESLAAMLRINPTDITPDIRLPELGLDSIVAVEWIRDINRRYEVLLSTSKVYEFPTIRELSKELERCRTASNEAEAGNQSERATP